MGWEHVLGRDDYELFRRNRTLLDEQVCEHFAHGAADPGILAAIRSVPRHLFVDAGYRLLAYTDHALPTVGGLTTSAPSVIAEMIYRSGASRGSRVLEVGTGTGYEAAVLAEMGARVVSMEIDATAAARAARILATLGYLARRDTGPARPTSFPNCGAIELVRGNGEVGFAERAPFDSIIVAASVARLESVRALAAQLSPSGGRLVVPVGPARAQVLCVVQRRAGRIEVAALDGLTFDFVRLIPHAGRSSSFRG